MRFISKITTPVALIVTLACASAQPSLTPLRMKRFTGLTDRAIHVYPDQSLVIGGGRGNAGYITKLSSAWTPVWDFQSTSGTWGTAFHRIVVDKDGNLRVTGNLGTDDAFSGIPVNHQYETDPLVGKMNPGGTFQWVRPINTAAWSAAFGAALAPDGAVYVTGYIYGSTTVGGISIGGAGWYDAFIAKLDAAGNWLWAKSVGGPDGDFGWDVEVGRDGSVYWLGTYRSAITIGGTALPFRGGGDINGGGDVFVAKLTPQGAWQWVVSAGSTGLDDAQALVMDRDDSLIVVDNPATAATFGSFSTTNSGCVLARLSTNGVWTGVTTHPGVRGLSMEPLSPGYFALAGDFAGTQTLGGTVMTNRGGRDAFLAVVESSGKALAAVSVGGSGDDIGFGIGVERVTGRIYFTGYGPGQVQSGSLVAPAPQGEQTFLLELQPSLPSVGIVKAFTLSFNGLSVGSQYQVQGAGNALNWTNWGQPFTATNSTFTNTVFYPVDTWGGIFFRLGLAAP